MTSESSLSQNPAWQAWNMSKRVSSANGYEREAMAIMAVLASDGRSPKGALDRARELVLAISEAASRSRLTWQRIQEALRQADASLIDQSDPRVSVLSNHGANPPLTAKIKAIWAEDDGASVAYWKFQELTALSSTQLDADHRNAGAGSLPT